MTPSESFDLSLAIDHYISRLDHNLLLNGQESDEIRDHFHCEVEELVDLGLSEEEAFEVSRLRFGENHLIQQEFNKIRPKVPVYKYLFAALTVILCIQFIKALTSLSDQLSVRLLNLLQMQAQTYIIIDFIVKGLFMILLPLFIFKILYRGSFSPRIFITLLTSGFSLIPLIHYLTKIIYVNGHQNFREYYPWNSLFQNTMTLHLVAFFLLIILTSVFFLRKGKELLLSR